VNTSQSYGSVAITVEARKEIKLWRDGADDSVWAAINCDLC
jgi:hypothetical protein